MGEKAPAAVEGAPASAEETSKMIEKTRAYPTDRFNTVEQIIDSMRQARRSMLHA